MKFNLGDTVSIKEKGLVVDEATVVGVKVTDVYSYDINVKYKGDLVSAENPNSEEYLLLIGVPEYFLTFNDDEN